MKNRQIDRAAAIKFGGLIAFFIILGFVVFLIWPYISDLFEPNGIERVLEDVRNAGAIGVLILFGLQFLQIVVAFIPGEITQIAAGLLYGPWFGALLIMAGCILSSAFIFVLVRKLGAPFVQGMVPTKYLSRFRDFEKTNKLNIIVFVLFLIPGLPKDTFTYLVPLTNMRMRTFLALSNIGRVPGVVMTTLGASSFAEGDFVLGAVVIALAAALGICGIVFRDRILDAVSRFRRPPDKVAGAAEAGKGPAEPEGAARSDEADPPAGTDRLDEADLPDGTDPPAGTDQPDDPR